MATLRLTYRGLCTRIDSPDAGELGWLAEFLGPGFGRDDDAPPACHVIVDENAPRLERLRAAVDQRAAPVVCLVQDSGPLCLPAAAAPSGAVLVRHDEADLAYEIAPDRRRIELVARCAGAARRTALMKLVRELAMSASWTETSLVLHAASCVLGSRAILIAGRKRAGKTSLLLHALGAPGARLLANDRTVLALAANGAVAHPMPTIVNLRDDTVAARFPDEAARGAAFRYRFPLTVAEAEQLPPSTDLTRRPLACSPAQLARLLGVNLSGAREAATLLLPQVDPAARGIAVEQLESAAAARRLRDVLFAAGTGPAISSVFALDEPSALPDTSALDALWRTCVQRLRVFACRLGPDAYATDPARLLEQVLAGAGPPGPAR